MLTAGHPFFWKSNFLGVSNTRAFYVFPAHLNSVRLLLAIYRPTVGDSFKLVFRGAAGEPAFDISVNVQGFSQVNAQAGSPISESEVTAGSPSQGWQLVGTVLGAEAMVNSQGNYEIFLTGDNTEQYIGAVTFAQLIVPPFTPEQINALKSDPLATKFIKLVYSCKFCHDQFKAYAGVERSESLEREVFQWNLDIRTEKFVCSCGKADINILPVKTGLHGCLQRNLNPQTSTNLSPVRLYEETTLEQFCRELLALIEGSSKEEKLQNFLESHPVFFHTFMPKKILFKPKILTKYVADFAVLNARDELLVIEIERPGIRLVKKEGNTTAELSHAFFQVRTWIQELNDHRAAVLDCWGMQIGEVARVKGVVVAGRRPNNRKLLKLLRAVSPPDTELFTYDDLLGAVTELIKHVASV